MTRQPIGPHEVDRSIRYALKIARNWSRRMPGQDPESAALLGLAKALDTFNPDLGWQWTTHLSNYVNWELQDDRWFRERGPRLRQAAIRRGTPGELHELPPLELDCPIHLEGAETIRLGHTLPATDDKPAQWDAVQWALARLTPHQREVVTRFYLYGEELEEIGGTYGSSRSAAFQAKSRALDRLRRLVGVETCTAE
jgi:DNA-directed RNA polymerase specialized sigma subunit